MKDTKFKLLGISPTGNDLYRFKIFYRLNNREICELFALEHVASKKIFALYGTDNLLPPELAILMRIYLQHPEFINSEYSLNLVWEDLFKNLLSSDKIFPLLFGFNNYRSEKWFQNDNTPIKVPIIKKFLFLLKIISKQYEDEYIAVKELFNIVKQEGLARNINPFIYGVWDTPTEYKYSQQELEVLDLDDLKYLNVDKFFNSYKKIQYQKNYQKNLFLKNAQNDELF